MLKSRSGEATSSFTVSVGPLWLRDRWFGTRPECNDDGETFMMAYIVKRVADVGLAHDGKTFLMAYVVKEVITP